jgi:hypothetical protein
MHMSTRKLIMWALFCGVLILGAGVFKLWQTTGDGAKVQLLQLGDSALLGDMNVSVNSVSKSATQTLVEVSMQGVEGADALSGWRMLVGGVISEAQLLVDNSGTACTTTKLAEPTVCTVAFPVSEGTPTIAYIRAGQQEQWATTP